MFLPKDAAPRYLSTNLWGRDLNGQLTKFFTSEKLQTHCCCWTEAICDRTSDILSLANTCHPKETLLDDRWLFVSYSVAWVMVAVAGGGDAGTTLESTVEVHGEFWLIYNTSPQKGTSSQEDICVSCFLIQGHPRIRSSMVCNLEVWPRSSNHWFWILK